LAEETGASAPAEQSTATQEVGEIAAALRASAPRGGLRGVAAAFPPTGRMALVGVAAAVFVLLAAGGAFAWLRSQTPAAGQPDPADRARAQYRLLLQEARTQLDAGHPEAAQAALDRAVSLAPGDPDLARMGARIRGQLDARQRTADQRQTQLQALRVSVRRALDAGDARQAAMLARQVLALVPADPQAEALLAEAQAAQDAQRRLSQASRAPPGTPTARPTASSATSSPLAGDPRAVAGPATLRIDFFTEQPEGVLTIYAGGKQILGEPFRFYKRTGLFRSQPAAGQIDASRQVPSGSVTLRIYVAPPKRAPVVRTFEAQLAPGSTRVLRIRFDKADALSVSLD
jgi:hypothetical protein